MASVTGYQYNFFEKTLISADAVHKDTAALYDTIQFGHYCVRAIQLVREATPLYQIAKTVGHAVLFLDCFQLIGDLHYFACGEVQDDWKKGRYFAIAASSIFPIATVGGTILIAAEILGAGFALIPAIGAVVLGAATVGHLFGLGNAIQSTVEAEKGPQKAKGMLDTISKVANVALHLLMVATAAAVVTSSIYVVSAIVLLGLVATGAAIAGFLVKYHYKELF